MLNYQYVTPQQLAGFEKYKYSAVDTNPLSVYVMQHLWNWIVKIVPLWIAPNLLTFTGFLMILLNYFLLSYYDWNFTASVLWKPSGQNLMASFTSLWGTITNVYCKRTWEKHTKEIGFVPKDSPNKTIPKAVLPKPGPGEPLSSRFYSSWGSHAPNWVWGLSGFATFSAYALDSIDGKHARRTQSSSPLGELFDHGLDSWATSLFTLSLFSVFGLAAEREVTAYTLYSILCVILLTFLLSHWEKYNTGVLYLPWGYDISQITLTAVYLLSAVVGVEAWYRPLPFGCFFTDILIAMVIGCCAFLSLPQTLYNIYQARKNKTLERNSTYEGLLPLASPALLFTLLTAWVKVSADDILTKHPRLFLWMVGVTFSNVTCRLIICQMTNTRSEVFHWLLLPLAAIVSAVSTGLLVQSELILLVGYTVLVTIAHVHYGLCVGKQLSKHLNIFIFSLEKRHQE